jgi:MFS family permease
MNLTNAPSGTIRSALRYPDFRWLLSALAVSQIGDWLYNLALVVLVYDRTHSALWAGVTTAARVVPVVVLGPLGGVLAGRFDRRRIMIICDLTRMGLMVLLAAVAAFQLPIVFAPVIAAAASSVLYGAQTVLLLLVSRQVGLGAQGYGYMFAAIGAGGLLGTALAGRVSRHRQSRSALAATLAVAGAPTLLLAVVRWPAAAIVLTGLTGMGALLVEILTETTLQRELDEDVFGRAYGIAFPAAIAGIVVGSVIAPGLAALLGASGALIVVGGTVLGYALLVIRGADDATAAPASRPAVADAVPAR